MKIVFLDYLSFPSALGVLCALARVNPRLRVFQVTGIFARAAKTFNYSNMKVSANLIPNFVLFVSFVVNNIFVDRVNKLAR